MAGIHADTVEKKTSSPLSAFLEAGEAAHAIGQERAAWIRAHVLSYDEYLTTEIQQSRSEYLNDLSGREQRQLLKRQPAFESLSGRVVRDEYAGKDHGALYATYVETIGAEHGIQVLGSVLNPEDDQFYMVYADRDGNTYGYNEAEAELGFADTQFNLALGDVFAQAEGAKAQMAQEALSVRQAAFQNASAELVHGGNGRRYILASADDYQMATTSDGLLIYQGTGDLNETYFTFDPNNTSPSQGFKRLPVLSAPQTTGEYLGSWKSTIVQSANLPGGVVQGAVNRLIFDPQNNTEQAWGQGLVDLPVGAVEFGLNVVVDLPARGLSWAFGTEQTYLGEDFSGWADEWHEGSFVDPDRRLIDTENMHGIDKAGYMVFSNLDVAAMGVGAARWVGKKIFKNAFSEAGGTAQSTTLSRLNDRVGTGATVSLPAYLVGVNNGWFEDLTVEFDLDAGIADFVHYAETGDPAYEEKARNYLKDAVENQRQKGNADYVNGMEEKVLPYEGDEFWSICRNLQEQWQHKPEPVVQPTGPKVTALQP